MSLSVSVMVLNATCNNISVISWRLDEFEDTKGLIRIRKSKKDRQHNGQKKKDKRTNNDLQKKNGSTFKNNITPLRQLTGNKECWIKSE